MHSPTPLVFQIKNWQKGFEYHVQARLHLLVYLSMGEGGKGIYNLVGICWTMGVYFPSNGRPFTSEQHPKMLLSLPSWNCLLSFTSSQFLSIHPYHLTAALPPSILRAKAGPY